MLMNKRFTFGVQMVWHNFVIRQLLPVLQALTKGGVTYKEEVWHKECFLCSGCSSPLAGQPFTSQGESPYCIRCFSSLYAKKCAGCNTAITGG